MLRSLSRARCALASSLLPRNSAEPPAAWSPRAKPRHAERRATCRTGRRDATRRTDARGHRR